MREKAHAPVDRGCGGGVEGQVRLDDSKDDLEDRVRRRKRQTGSVGRVCQSGERDLPSRDRGRANVDSGNVGRCLRAGDAQDGAHASEEDERSALSAGAVEFLRKPISKEALLNAIRDALV